MKASDIGFNWKGAPNWAMYLLDCQDCGFCWAESLEPTARRWLACRDTETDALENCQAYTVIEKRTAA